jgi:hypothetical protein
MWETLINWGFAGIILAFHWFRTRQWDKERNQLLNRIMARNYEEFKYYEEKYPKDIGELQKIRQEERKERGRDNTTPPDIMGDEAEAVARKIDGFEEDWGDEEVDQKAILESIKKGE